MAMQEAPYPPSPVIGGVAWDFITMQRAAPGSDLWPVTWGADGHLYTSWGDGGGFGGTNNDGRVSIGVARVEGGADSWQGFNVWGGKDPESSQASTTGKSNGGIIDIDGSLYLYVEEQDRWDRAKLWKSVDHGLHWTDLGWILDEPDGAFSRPGIIQFGPGYQGTRDNYVYGYSDNGFTNGLGLFRVPKDQLDDRAAYEFFAGLDKDGGPLWSADINARQPVFTDSNGVGWGVNAVYHPGLNRYLLAVSHDEAGGWGIFDAPEPWGPWTTVAYYDGWIDSEHKFTFVFPQKWMSQDSSTVWMVFSGLGEYDAFNLVKGTLSLRTSPLPTPTLVPTPEVNLCCHVRLPLVCKASQSGGDPGDLITDITVKNGKAYEQGILDAGELVYIDRSFTFTSIAPGYTGQAYIRTSNDDKSETDADFLSFTLSADATVYVVYDYRVTQLPAWLESWTPVGGADGSTATIDVIKTSDGWRRLYKKDFPAGTVTLGGNAMPPMAGAASNYSVIANAGAHRSVENTSRDSMSWQPR